MRKIGLFLLFTCMGFVSFTVADLAGYTIHKYDIEMDLHEDGAMEVQETIEVNFSEARHGIYRTIPYYSPSGRYTVIQQMQAIGDPASFSTENNTYQLKIGSASSTLIGNHTYHISYTVENAIAGFEEGTGTRTELYWNVIGTERATTIDNVGLKLHLPKETAFFSGDYYIVYGKQGEKKTEGSQLSLSDENTFVGSINTRLGNNEGATIGVKFPSDYFNLSEEYLAIKAPNDNVMHSPNTTYKSDKSVLMFVINYIHGIFYLFFGGIVLSIIRKNKKQKIHKITYTSNKPVTIYYTPPKNIDITLSSRIFNTTDARTFAAFMYYRASQGYITIEGKKETTLWFFVKKRFFLHKSLKFDQAMGIHQLLLQNFFRKKEKFKLSDFVYNKFESYKKIFEGQMKLAVEPYRIIIKRKFLGVFPYEKATLNEQGQHLYEEIRGFAYFLGHVEEPRLKQMLKDNPYYIDEVLPRAVLFGVETEFLKAAEQYIGALQNPEWYSGDVMFSPAVIYDFISQVQHATIPPSNAGGGGNSGSGGGGSSGFSGRGGSSGGGGGGGGGGSW